MCQHLLWYHYISLCFVHSSNLICSWVVDNKICSFFFVSDKRFIMIEGNHKYRSGFYIQHIRRYFSQLTCMATIIILKLMDTGKPIIHSNISIGTMGRFTQLLYKILCFILNIQTPKSKSNLIINQKNNISI